MQGPVEIAYYYKARWGTEREFRELFIKNHLPILLAQKRTGRFLDIRMYEPKFHGEGRADWHFMTVLTFADWAAVGVSVGISAAGLAMVVLAFLDPEPTSKLGLLVGGGAVCVLTGGLTAVGILTRRRPPNIEVSAGGFSIRWE